MARAASVSVATVSRVWNGKGPVSPETERRIRRAARRLRYVPHGGARSLITRRTHTLGVLLPDLYSEFFSELIRGVDVVARRNGYHLLVSGSHGDSREAVAMARAMRGRVDGLIVLVPDVRRSALRESLPEGFPVIILNDSAGRPRTFDSIGIDNFGGATAMVRHLTSLGHRRIAFICGPPRNHDASERLRGYRRAMRDAEVPWSKELEFPGDFREQTGYEACRRILELDPRPSAVFAANDSMAIGLLYACRELGVSVPDELAVTGFDDIPIARFMTPPLTSVHVPIAELGTCAAERLVDRLAEKTASEARREVELPTTLVVRASCGAAASSRSTRTAPPGSPERIRGLRAARKGGG